MESAHTTPSLPVPSEVRAPPSPKNKSGYATVWFIIVGESAGFMVHLPEILDLMQHGGMQGMADQLTRWSQTSLVIYIERKWTPLASSRIGEFLEAV